MCPIKTETISFNVPREEAQFWRKVAFDLKARSRGQLQKMALLMGLEKLSPERAAQLREIRQRYYGRQGAAAIHLFLAIGFTVQVLCGHDVGNAARRARSRPESARPFVRNLRWEGAASA